MATLLRVNLGGEGEAVVTLNQQGPWVLDPSWRSSREGRTLDELRAAGHRFVVSDNRFLPFADNMVDEVVTNSVPVDGPDTWLGPPIQSSEVRRILKPQGKWIDNDQVVYVKP